VQVAVLEGQRPHLQLPVRGLIEDFAGVSAFMEIDALRRAMKEGATVSGAYLTVDDTKWDAFMKKIKSTPRLAATIVKKDQLRAFRTTTGESIGILRRLYLTLAVIVAFGVVYNSAHRSERTRA
jgi:putative ABC transport system permease protein